MKSIAPLFLLVASVSYSQVTTSIEHAHAAYSRTEYPASAGCRILAYIDDAGSTEQMPLGDTCSLEIVGEIPVSIQNFLGPSMQDGVQWSGSGARWRYDQQQLARNARHTLVVFSNASVNRGRRHNGTPLTATNTTSTVSRLVTPMTANTHVQISGELREANDSGFASKVNAAADLRVYDETVGELLFQRDYRDAEAIDELISWDGRQGNTLRIEYDASSHVAMTEFPPEGVFPQNVNAQAMSMIQVSHVIPEPNSAAIATVGLLGLFQLRRRNR